MKLLAKCKHCEKSFFNNTILSLHQTKIIVSSDKNYKCAKCEKNYNSNNELESHVSAVHDKSKNFVCATCNKAFSLKSNFKKHFSVIHERKKCFKCKACEKSFSYECYLKRHVEEIHEKSTRLYVTHVIMHFHPYGILEHIFHMYMQNTEPSDLILVKNHFYIKVT